MSDEQNARIWAAWKALPDNEPSPVKRIARQLDMKPADVAAVVYPSVQQFGVWSDDQEPDLPPEDFADHVHLFEGPDPLMTDMHEIELACENVDIDAWNWGERVDEGTYEGLEIETTTLERALLWVLELSSISAAHYNPPRCPHCAYVSTVAGVEATFGVGLVRLKLPNVVVTHEGSGASEPSV